MLLLLYKYSVFGYLAVLFVVDCYFLMLSRYIKYATLKYMSAHKTKHTDEVIGIEILLSIPIILRGFIPILNVYMTMTLIIHAVKITHVTLSYITILRKE